MHTACTPTKTISLKLEAYERLRAARRYPGESFSQVVLRATWPEQTVTGAELLAALREQGPHFAEPELDAIERVTETDAPPESKWTRP